MNFHKMGLQTQHGNLFSASSAYKFHYTQGRRPTGEVLLLASVRVWVLELGQVLVLPSVVGMEC